MVNFLPDRREQNLESRLREWIDKLFDLSRRNGLLYFNDPDQKRSLTIHGGDATQLSRLVRGESVRASELLPAERLTTALTRIRKIQDKAIENYEERSIETLTIAIGMLTWTEEVEDGSRRSPRAPILLADLEISRVKGRNDFSILMSSESFRLNQALRYKLQRDFGIRVSLGTELDDPSTGSQRFESFRTSHVPDADEVAGADQSGIDDDLGDSPGDPRELIRRLLAPQVAKIPGVKVEAEHVLIGNFSSARLAMIQDLEASRSNLIDHDFVMAMADDRDAKDRVRDQPGEIDPTEPNRTAPSDEFLILDADASQNEVINAIVRGKSFAFDGPPGTGKSQTIANAIATLVARGKRVLFVAEKRAAIDAVLTRLQQKELGDLVMDFHATSQRRREFIRKLRDTSEVARQVLTTSASQPSDELARARKHLIERTAALHDKRPELGTTLYDLLSIVHRAPESFNPEDISFAQKTLRKLSYERVAEIKGRLTEYVDYGGVQDSEGARLWRTCTHESQEELEEFQEILEQFEERDISEIRGSLSRFATQIELQGASPSATIEVFPLVSDLCAFADEYSWAILGTDASEAREFVRRGSSRFGGLILTFSSTGRRKKAEIRRLIGRRIRSSEAISAIGKAVELQTRWREISKGAPIPLKSPSGLAETGALIRRYEATCESLVAIPELSAAVRNLSDRTGQMISELRRERLVVSGLLRTREIERWLQDAAVTKAISQITAAWDIPEQIGDRFEEAWAHAQIAAIMNTDPRLVSMDSSRIRSFNTRFAEADVRHLEDTPARIRKIWATRFEEAATTHAAEYDALVQTFHQSRNLPSVRQLFGRTRHALCALKPCWVTSPLSVSTLRPPSQWFDVVIFDEASQIKPVHAVTSIKAARQVVVAGDDEQLPPTDFFADDGGDGSSDDSANDADGSIRLDLTEIRSLLGATKAIITRPRQLRWHYRSRDERLIGFSNDRIYKSLITFPHSDSLSPISHVLVDQFPDNVTSKATNKAEVRSVVELVKSHAFHSPEDSLGVIALGKPHADAILDAVERERDVDPDLAAFLDSTDSDPFFVKNLERVQGDERDSIILSIGYGRRDDGSLNYTFGPVNGEDGYRRLNVATTRAKSRMTVVSTFKGEEMIESRCQGGTLFLRDYLIYARSGGLILGRADNSAPPLNPFEKSIQRALEAEGLELVPQHGVGRFRIDFAVRHPSDPGKFVLAVECDGASYHSYPTARDRDRLRQQILESRGWRFHRIWSTDWFRNPEEEVQRVLKSYHAAIGN
jgi:very-short-patch-repair endonuclease